MSPNFELKYVIENEGLLAIISLRTGFIKIKTKLIPIEIPLKEVLSHNF